MRRSFFAYVYNKGEQKLANTVRTYDLYYTNVGDGVFEVDQHGIALEERDVLQHRGHVARHVEQRGVFQLALDLVVAPAQRVLEVMRDVLVELLILLVLDLGTRTGPQRAGLVGGFPFAGFHHGAGLAFFLAFFPLFLKLLIVVALGLTTTVFFAELYPA